VNHRQPGAEYRLPATDRPCVSVGANGSGTLNRTEGRLSVTPWNELNDSFDTPKELGPLFQTNMGPSYAGAFVAASSDRPPINRACNSCRMWRRRLRLGIQQPPHSSARTETKGSRRCLNRFGNPVPRCSSATSNVLSDGAKSRRNASGLARAGRVPSNAIHHSSRFFEARLRGRVCAPLNRLRALSCNKDVDFSADCRWANSAPTIC
jgi:hypothetical protein